MDWFVRKFIYVKIVWIGWFCFLFLGWVIREILVMRKVMRGRIYWIIILFYGVVFVVNIIGSFGFYFVVICFVRNVWFSWGIRCFGSGVLSFFWGISMGMGGFFIVRFWGVGILWSWWIWFVGFCVIEWYWWFWKCFREMVLLKWYVYWCFMNFYFFNIKF